MFINHIAHFTIVTRLMHLFTPKARIVVLSSGAHTFVRGKGLYLDEFNLE